MTFIPRHRKKRHPLDRQVLGTYKPPPAESVRHQWREDVGNCVCCWHVCDVCRLCKCQARTKPCVPREDA